MTVNEVYILVQYICSKNQQGYISPDDFDTVINQAQNDYQAFLLGSFQSYQIGRAVSRVEFGQNSVIRQRLSPTIKSVALSIDAAGVSAYPPDYIQTDSMYTTTTNKRIRNVQQHYLDANINSVIDPVSDNPIYLIEKTGFQFYPINIGGAKLSYIGKAPKIVWGYTPDADDIPVYNSTKSSDPVWSDASMMDIISRALRMISASLQDVPVMQYANEIKSIGA